MTGSFVRILFIASALILSPTNFGAEAVHDELMFKFFGEEEASAEPNVDAKNITQEDDAFKPHGLRGVETATKAAAEGAEASPGNEDQRDASEIFVAGASAQKPKMKEPSMEAATPLEHQGKVAVDGAGSAVAFAQDVGKAALAATVQVPKAEKPLMEPAAFSEELVHEAVAPSDGAAKEATLDAGKAALAATFQEPPMMAAALSEAAVDTADISTRLENASPARSFVAVVMFAIASVLVLLILFLAMRPGGPCAQAMFLRRAYPPGFLTLGGPLASRSHAFPLDPAGLETLAPRCLSASVGSSATVGSPHHCSQPILPVAGIPESGEAALLPASIGSPRRTSDNGPASNVEDSSELRGASKALRKHLSKRLTRISDAADILSIAQAGTSAENVTGSAEEIPQSGETASLSASISSPRCGSDDGHASGEDSPQLRGASKALRKQLSKRLSRISDGNVASKLPS